MRIKSGFRSNKPTTVNFFVPDNGRKACIGWTNLELTSVSQAIYLMQVADDSIHVDSLVGSQIYDEAMFACRKTDGTIFAAWPVYGSPNSNLWYSSNLQGSIFANIKHFTVANLTQPFGFFLDPYANNSPSYISAVNRAGLHYLKNLEENTDSNFLAIPSLLQLSTGIAADAKNGVLAVYLDTSGSQKLLRIYGNSTGVNESSGRQVCNYHLAQNYPNPFNPSTKIEYTLPQQSQVRLKIFNIFGQEVATLVNGLQEPGNKSIIWNAGCMASGVYFYRIEAVSVAEPGKSYREVKKMIVVK
jgi:hypothetical protein